jgi:hypothetical protein
MKMQSPYESWVGKHVLLQVVAGDLKVPVRGTLLGETENALKFRIGDGWDVEIFKSMVMAVEEDSWMSIVT